MFDIVHDGPEYMECNTCGISTQVDKLEDGLCEECWEYLQEMEGNEMEPLNPREHQDNLGQMICFHKRYALGDKHNLSTLEVVLKSENKNYISLPLYLYDHSGLSINTTGFNCPWDSGQVGFIMVHKETVRKEWGIKRITPKIREAVLQALQNEVEEYDRYLRHN